MLRYIRRGAIALTLVAASIAASLSCGDDKSSGYIGDVREDPKNPQDNEQPTITDIDTLEAIVALGLVEENNLPNENDLNFAAYDLNYIPELNSTLEDAFLKTREDDYRDDPRFKSADYDAFVEEYLANETLRESLYEVLEASTDEEKSRINNAVEAWANNEKLEIDNLGLGVLPAKDGTKYVALLMDMRTEDNERVIGYKLHRYDQSNSTGLQKLMNAFHESLGGSLGYNFDFNYFGKDPFKEYVQEKNA